MKKIFLTSSAKQTQKLGNDLMKMVLKKKLGKTAFVVSLKGDLGGGKTTFLQGFAKGLGIKEKILSPTFVIMRKFHVSCSMFHDFYHIDCYRIKKPREILNLEFKEIIFNPQNIIAIEWADRIRKILPKKTIIFKFEFLDQTKRKISLAD